MHLVSFCRRSFSDEGKIIASILMIIGIGILGVLISTIDASFIESKLKPKINIEAKESKKR